MFPDILPGYSLSRIIYTHNPALLYAAETWTVNKQDEKRLLAFEMRRILAVKCQDRRTNEEIRAVVQAKRNSGGYNSNEEVPTIWAYLQDAR